MSLFGARQGFLPKELAGFLEARFGLVIQKRVRVDDEEDRAVGHPNEGFSSHSRSSAGIGRIASGAGSRWKRASQSVWSFSKTRTLSMASTFEVGSMRPPLPGGNRQAPASTSLEFIMATGASRITSQVLPAFISVSEIEPETVGGDAAGGSSTWAGASAFGTGAGSGTGGGFSAFVGGSATGGSLKGG